MNTLNFLLEDLIYEAVLLYYRHPFKCLARNSNGKEGPTATRNVLYEQLGGLETF